MTSCDCHEHEHAHDHQHEHTHEHDHGDCHHTGCTHEGHQHTEEHACGHFETSFGFLHVGVNAHNEAAVASLDLRFSENAQLPFQTLVDRMNTLAQEIEACGGVVGHIKAFVSCPQGIGRASVTGAGLIEQEAEDDEGPLVIDASSQLDFVAIALLITPDQLLSLCQRVFQ